MTYTCRSIGCVRPVNDRHDFCTKCQQDFEEAAEFRMEQLTKQAQTEPQLTTEKQKEEFLNQVEKTATEDTSPLAVQVGGDHYKSLAIQPIEYIYANDIGYFEGNVIKYVSRWKAKNGIADLQKAKHYIELLIELEKQRPKSA